MKFLHGRGYVHLDIKHDNILLDKDLNPKLADLGFTLKVPDDGLIRNYSKTMEYAAPEVKNEIPFDGKKADIYSLGVVFYSMILGGYPD